MITPLRLDTQTNASSRPRRRIARSALWLKAAVAVGALGALGALASTQLGASAPKLAGTADAMAAPVQPVATAAADPAQQVDTHFTVERPAAGEQAAPTPAVAGERPTTTAAGGRPRLPFDRSRSLLPASDEGGQPITRPTDVDPHVAAAIAASRAAAPATDGATPAAPVETTPPEIAAPVKDPAVAATEPTAPSAPSTTTTAAATAASIDPPAPAPAATGSAPAASASTEPAPPLAALPTPSPPPTPAPAHPAAAPAPPTKPAAAPAPTKPVAPASTPVMRLASHDVQVNGSLSQRTVERAITRVAAELAGCARLATAKRAKVRFTIDERGRAGTITTEGGGTELAGCLRTALGSLRTETPPDVGTVDAVLTLSFVPKAS